MDAERITLALERIALALDEWNRIQQEAQGHDDHAGFLQEATENQRRQLDLTERQIKSYEEHVRAHRDAGLPPVEPSKDIPIQ